MLFKLVVPDLIFQMRVWVLSWRKTEIFLLFLFYPLAIPWLAERYFYGLRWSFCTSRCRILQHGHCHRTLFTSTNLTDDAGKHYQIHEEYVVTSCGSRRCTLRRVLEYLPQSTTTDSGKCPPAFRTATHGIGQGTHRTATTDGITVTATKA